MKNCKSILKDILSLIILLILLGIALMICFKCFTYAYLAFSKLSAHLCLFIIVLLLMISIYIQFENRQHYDDYVETVEGIIVEDTEDETINQIEKED